MLAVVTSRLQQGPGYDEPVAEEAMAEGGRLEDVLSLLRVRGGRVTSPRRAILRALIARAEPAVPGASTQAGPATAEHPTAEHPTAEHPTAEHPTAEHPTAEQLTADVQRHQPDVHPSTVYRFLDELEELGVIDHTHLGHGPAVYHFTDDRHHHLVCERCGSVVEVADEAFAGLRRHLRREVGFELRTRHFAVPGLCGRCRSTGEG